MYFIVQKSFIKCFFKCNEYDLIFSVVCFSLNPLQRRQLEGCLCRVPSMFYGQVWDILCRTPHGIQVMSYELPQQPTLSSMTRSEIKFALLVEQVLKTFSYLYFILNIFIIIFQMLNHIQIPEYRQIVVELLCIVSTILRRNPELMFNQPLDLDLLIKNAAHMYAKVSINFNPNRQSKILIHYFPG